MSLPEPVVAVHDLRVTFHSPSGDVSAVDGVSFDLYPGETLAVVGESGSGKSAMSMALVGLNRSPGTSISGSVQYNGTDLVGASERELRRVRGRDIAAVFQDSLAALNPLHRVGEQVVEIIREHRTVSRTAAREQAIGMLAAVGIAQPAERARAFPHQFSGGMRQRVMTAIALANDPAVLIADEPTTALDVTIQAQILQLLADLQREHGTAVVLITHDLGVVADIADRVAVMYAGRIVEIGPADDVLHRPRHPYTLGLLASTPSLSGPIPEQLPAIPGSPPSGFDRPGGCAFSPRCGRADSRCATRPTLVARPGAAAEHLDACWYGTELAGAGQ